MPETIVTTQPVSQPNNIPADNPSEPSSISSPSIEDIVTRVSGVVPKSPEPQEVDILEGSDFDRNKWNEFLSKLTPEQKQLHESAYKSLQKGAQKKFQEASELKKQSEAKSKRPSLQELLQDPEFFQEAQSYLQKNQSVPENSNLTAEQWSALNTQEQASIKQALSEARDSKMMMQQMRAEQEDQQLKQRYKNYNPQLIKDAIGDLMSGKATLTREHIYKALDYEDAIQRGYQLGLQDRALNTQEKKDALSLGGNGGTLNIKPAEEIPAKQPGQSFSDHWRNIANRRLQQAKESLGKK